MFDNTKKYSFTLPDGRSGVWTEEQMQKGREALYKKYPDAQVMSLTEYNAAQGIDDDAMYVIDTGDGRTSTWDSAQMMQGYDALMAKYPHTKVMRAKQDTYWQDKAAEQTAALNKFDADNDEFFRQHEKDTALYNTGESSRINFDEEGYLERDRQYRELQSQRQQMEIERANNPYIKAMYESQSRKSDEDIARYDEQIAALKSSDNKDRADLRNLRQARKLARDTKDVYDVDVANSNDGFAEYVRNMGQGAGDVFGDADFWSRGLTSIARNINIHSIEKRLNKDGRSLYDLTEEEIDKELTPTEKDLFIEFIRNASAQAERAGNMARGYTAGQSAAESVGFMAEFIVTAGIAKGIGTALDAAESGLGKWIARELTGKTAEAITSTAGKVAYNAIARPVEKAIFHTALHPTTYSSIAEALTQIDDNGQLVKAGNAIASTILDQFIENWSESIGEPIEKILPPALIAKGAVSKTGQKILSKIGKADWAKMWVDSDVHRVLIDAGFNGLVGEMAEEWAGNAVRLSTGLMDKDEFAKFASWDEQVDMMASFAPMSLFGLGSQSVAAHRLAKERNANLALVRDALTRQGWTEQEIHNVLDTAHTKAEIKEMLRPVVNNIVSQRTNGGNVTTDYLAMLDFARINEMGEILDEARKYEREQSRASMRQAIEMGLGATDANPDSGRFSYMVPSVNEDGTTSEQEMVTTITDDAGNIWYLIGQDNAKVILRKKGDTSGQPFFITIDEYDERLVDGSYKEYTTTVDEYLDSEVEAQRKAQESRRINDAVTTQYEALNKRMMQNPEINLGTDETPKIGIIQEVRRDGVIIAFETPIDLGAGPKLIHKISLDGALNALGESSIADTRTDDQIAIDEANREYVQEQRLKQLNKMYRSSSVNVNGEQLTVERVSDLPYNTEDGNEVIKVAARNASGEINEIVVPVSDIQVNEQISEVDNTDVTSDTNLDFRGNPLPMTTAEDGVTQIVDETALWNRDPEAYLRWNDARRNGVTDNSERYLGANIANLTKQMQALDKAQAEDLDPQVWQSNEDKKAALANKINLYQSLLNGYQVERQTKEALAQIQQQTSEMYRKLLMAQTPEQTAEINAKIDALREQYYATIAQGLEGQAFAERKVNILNWVKGYADMPVKTVDLSDVIGIIREDGATESQIEECQAMVNKIFAARRSGKYYVINGFHLNGTIYLFAEGCINEDVTKATFYHEREHEITERDPLILQPVIDAFGGDYKQIESAVEAISGTTVYNGSKIEVLADELVAFSIERLYLGRDAARELLDIGIPEEFINYIIDLYGKQTTDGYRLPTKQNGSQYVGRHSVTGGEPDGTVEAGTSGDGRLDAPTNGGSTDRERIGSEVTSLYENAPGETPIQGLETYTRDELKSIVREYVSSILSENGIESELVDVELHGSRGRGTARKDSDLDAVVEYRGDIREDGMFNLLNAEDSRLVIDGITVDVNPIRAEETGTMASYMERSRRYDAEMTGQPAFRTVAITPEVRKEMDDIIAEAKKDGTYLKAPNGKDTKLSPEQWAMVRTEAFKKWFGDWEKVMRIEKLRKSRSASITGNEIVLGKDYSETRKNALAYGKSLRGEYTNKDTGNKFLLVAGKNGGIKEILEHDYKDMPHLLSIAAIPQIAEESIYIDSVNNEDLKKHPDIVKYDYYVCGLTIGKEEYTVKAAIAVTKDGQKYYDHKLTEIEKGKLIDELANINLSQSGLSSVATSGESNVNYPAVNGKDITGSPISGIKDKRLVSILQTNSSKVVDENGEPMVVYHGLKGNDFNVFDKDIAAENSRSSQPVYGAFFFSDNKDNASAYGTKSDNGVRSLNGLKEVFLKADNPFVVDANGEQYHSVKAYFKERDTGEINWERGGIVMDGNEVGVQDITIAARDLGYDSVIFKNIDDPGSEDFVGKPQTTIAVFSPTQIKSATDSTGEYSNDNPDVRFRAVPVEGNKNLVAIHNLKEQDLRNAFELGGFPMPSIAITKAEVGHTDFGDISLIFDKNSIDPRNRKNKVYGGDAWTPMFPKIAYKLNYDKTRDIYRRAVNVGELPMFNSSNFNNVNYEDSIDDTGESGLINSFKDDYGAKQFFLAEQGNPVLAYETKEADKYDARTVGRINELLNTIGLENLKKQDYLNVSPEVIDLLRTWFDKLDDKMLNRVGRNYVQKAIDYAENGNKKTEVDYEATRRKIDERVDTVAFEKWLEDMFSGIVEKRGIRNEVDLYTPSGNRRPFEKLYDDITLDNVVKAMSRAPEKGGSGFFHGNIFGAASGTFGSLTQIREAAKQRIESIEPSEIEKDKKAIIDRLSNVKVTDKELDISEMFDLTSNIQDAVAKTHTPEGIYKYLKEFYPDTTLEAAQEISDIVKDIQQLSTRYFEAKPYRAVGFDEVKLAVVPEGTSQDIFDGLRERGVDVRTYTDGDQEQRKQVVADTAKETGLNFRINADERKYANENIDKAIAFVRGISVKEASDMRKDDERRIKEKTTELYSKVLDNQFDDITLQLIDEFIANVTPNNPYRQPLSKRLPPSVGRRMRGVERNNAVDGLFTRIAESTVREAGSSVERTRARREAEEKKKELLKGWAIATGNWHTSVSDFTDNTEPIGKGKDSVVYNSNDGNNVIKVSFGKNKEKKFSPDIDAVNLFNAVFPNTRYEILGYGEIDGKFVKFLKQPSVRFSENPTVSVEDRIDYMRNLGFEPINKEKSAFSNGELVVADVQKGNIVRDVNGKIRVIDADVKLHTKDIGGNYTYPPASDDILPQSSGISFRTANENQQVFISNTLASLDKIPMKSGNAQAWINRIQQSGGLKKEEDKWIGLTDWLKEQDGNISKDDVAEYVREHQVRIEDVNYGESVVFVKDRLAKKYGDIVNEAFQMDEEYGEGNIYVKDLDKAIEFYNSQNTITPILDSLYMDEDGEVDQRAMEDTLIEWMSGIASEVASENENKEIDPIRLQYTTGGLVKNREIALVVPDIQPYNKTDLVHFGDAGEGRAIAWARFGDAKDADGNKVLVIDEIQSKRHQDAKELGYKDYNGKYQRLIKESNDAERNVDDYVRELQHKYGLSKWMETLKAANYEYTAIRSLINEDEYNKLESLKKISADTNDKLGSYVAENPDVQIVKDINNVPDAPFRDSWDALAMKRMLRLAAEEGYDKIAWTNGQMQSDRYDLTKVLEDFYYKPNGDGTYKISAALKQRRNGYEDYSDINYDSLTAERIGEIFGKEIAGKVSEGKGRKGYSHNNEGDWVTFKGRDLKVSNEGMRYFYDQKLVNWMNKYGKKWGVQVEDLTLHGLENKEGWHSVDITPEMKESVMEGQVMFSVTDNNLSGFKIAKSDIGAVLNRMEEAAIIPETVPYDITEWNKRLAGKIPTQVGELIMGAHQFVKLDPKFNEQHQDRRGWIGMIDATIHNPLMIVTQDEAGNYQRQFKLVFAKTFKNKEKDDAVFFVSISVLKDTHEAVITSHIRPKKEFGKILENGVVVFSSISMNGIQTEDVQPQLSGTTTPSNKQVGATSKDTNSLDKNNSSDTSFRVTPAQDAEYRKAYEDNDIAKATQMVKEAAERSGYTAVGYHGTIGKVKRFYPDRDGNIFFATEKDAATAYALANAEQTGSEPNTISAFLDLGKTKRIDAKGENWDEIDTEWEVSSEWDGYDEVFDNFEDAQAEALKHKDAYIDTSGISDTNDIGKDAREAGYDSVIIENVYDRIHDFYDEMQTDIILFNPRRIKSAEPFTFDDDGKLIPLSERFNRGKEDLRFRTAEENESRYRIIPGGESMAERTYRETGAFSFTGKNKIESVDDVAFIFRELQNAATENSFLVLVKDGVPTILHTGIGTIDSTPFDMYAAIAGYNDFAPDTVYMVHNHPSGAVVASSADIKVFNQLQDIFKDVEVQGIILDTVSGNYGIFGSDDMFGRRSTEERTVPEDGVEYPIKVLAFDRQVFDNDFKSQMNARRITKAEDVAGFLSAHRLGKGDKLGVLLLNNNNTIMANYVTNDNVLTEENASLLAEQVANAAAHNMSTSAILFGSFNFDMDTLSKFRKSLAIASGSLIRLLDIVQFDKAGNYRSVSEGSLNGRKDGAMFRITPEETPKDTSMEPDVAFASLPIGYAEIQNRLKNEGLAEVGDEDVSDLMMHLFSNANEDIRQTVLANAPSYGYNISKAIGYYYASLAQKDELSDAERVAVNKMRDDLAQTVGIDNLSASDALWMMYRTMNPISNDVFDIAKDTEVAARLGHSAQGIQARRQAEDAVRMSVTEAMHSQSAAEMYNQAVAYWKNRLKEGYVDMFESVNDLMASMEKATGVKAEEFEDIRIALNQQSSKALNRMKKYTSDYLEPLWQAIADVVSTANFHMDDVVRYVELKHALERNVVFAKRDAIAYHTEEHDSLVKPLKEELKDLKKQLKDAIKNGDVNEQTRINDRINTINADIADYDNDLARKLNKVDNGTDTKYLEFREKDYAGLTGMFSEYPGLLPRNRYKTDEEYNKAARKLRQPKFDNLRDMENEAQFEIDVFENAIGKDQVDNLWQKINAATKETLRSQYASGLLSKSQYESVSKMFKYYVPLRGFKDDVAEDIWSYYSSAPVGSFSVPIITAKGRTSEADNPFLWIGTMASSAIAQNVKNESKLALYYYAMNNPGQDLVKVQDMWYELDAAETARQGHKVFVAAYPPLTAGMAPTDAVNAYNTWEESMRQKASIGQAYTRHGKFSTNEEVAFIDDKKKAEHFIRLKANGRDVLMFINGSPRAAQAVNGLLNVENTKDILMSRWLLRLMSSFNTSWNPEFWISNMQRDLIFSIMSMEIKGDGMSNFRRNLITPVRMMRLAKAYENGTLNSLEGKDKKYANYYREFADGGAITGYTVVKGNEMWEKEIDRWMKSNGVNYTGKGKDSLRGVKNVVGKFFGKFNELGEAVEQISRFSAFVSAREAGKSIANAVSDAKELTVNFNRKGSGNAIEWSELDQLTKADGTRLNMAEKAVVYAASLIPAYGRRFVMFFNAAIQGLNTMYNLWKTDKRKTTKWMSGYFAMGALQALIHAMLDDDDDYLNIPEYTRRANAMIGAGGIYFKWALPQEARLFYATGDILVQRALGNEKERGALPNISQGALDIINQALDLSPINPAGGITDILPSIAQPFVENIINKDFTGANVYYENKYLTEDERARTPKFTNTKRGTSGWAINAAKLINYISGGDKDDAGALNWHPESIQNIIEGIGGGTLTTIGKIGDTVTGLAGQGDLTVRRTLFLNRLFEFEGERNQQYHTNELYRFYKGEAEHTKTKLKKYKKAGDFGEQADLMGSEDYEIYLIFERYQKMLEPYEEQLKIEESSEEKRILNREMDALKREMIHEISNL